MSQYDFAAFFLPHAGGNMPGRKCHAIPDWLLLYPCL